jgi:glycosidase
MARLRSLAAPLFAASLSLAIAACGDIRLGAGGAGGAGGALDCDPPGTPCVVEFTYPLGNEKSVELRGDFAPGAWDAGVSLTLEGVSWKATVAVPPGTTIRYKFVLDGTTWVNDPTNPLKEPDGFGGENSIKTANCELVPCPVGVGGAGGGGGAGNAGTGGDPPEGQFDWRSAVMYFVFVDRFRNGDPSNDAPVPNVPAKANYQGGDYAGLLEMIESGYFDDLGVNALWLTVPMDNPSVAGPGADGYQYSAYHGYWPTDLDAVEEHFGTLADLKAVVDASHARGIKVLIDYAMNHVHADAPVYQEHPEWFWPLDYDGKYCVCGDGCSWDDSYEQKRCWFRDYLPDWNFQNAEARAFSIDNAMKWIEDTGIDGYRLDAVKHIELSWITDLRARLQAEVEPVTGEKFYLVGETFESGNREVIKSFVGPDKLDGQFDFPLRGVMVETVLRRSGSMYDLDGFLATNDAYYPGIMSTFIGNHDIARVIQTALDQPWDAWGNGSTDVIWNNSPGLPPNRAPFERLAVAFTLLMTTKGIPLIYYGDEIGLPGAGDPDNRRFMQWDGLTEDQLFLRERMQRLGRLRKDHPALWKGTRTTVSVSHDTYAYRLDDGNETIYVVLNRGDLPGSATGLPALSTDLLSDNDVQGPTVSLAERSAYVLVAK